MSRQVTFDGGLRQEKPFHQNHFLETFLTNLPSQPGQRDFRFLDRKKLVENFIK